MRGYEMDQEGQAALYADIISWGKTYGLAGIRYWAPDFEGWYAMSMFSFSDRVGKSILSRHEELVQLQSR